MRVAGVALALVLQAVAFSSSGAAASPVYSGAYAGQSSFVSAVPGSGPQFIVAYLNDGTATWEPKVVGLVACDVDGKTCGASADVPLSDTDWYAPDVYASLDASVAPGEIGFFEIEVGVPGGTEPGSALAFAGNVGLIDGRTVFGNAAFHEEVDIPMPGIAERLTISGLDTPQVVGDALTMAVDIDDVNVELVGDDDTTLVTAALDPATCSGAAGGPVTLGSVTSTATDGRAWFTFHSLGAYAGCRVAVTAPGLLSNATTIAFAPGAPARLGCSFAPSVVTQDTFANAAVDVRDIYGNVTLAAGLYTIAFARVSGAATDLVTADEQVTRAGAAFFTVRGTSIGRDTFQARDEGSSLMPADCTLGVIGG